MNSTKHAATLAAHRDANLQAPFPWSHVIALFGLIGSFSLSVGYVYPAVAFRLEHLGYSATMIGAQSAMSGVGVIVSAFLAPHLAARFGQWLVSIGSVLLCALMLVLLAIVPPVAAWFPIRFLLGMGGSLIFIMGESWLLQVTPEGVRGRVVGAYTAFIAGVFALGPGLIAVIGFKAGMPYLLMAVLIVAFAAPLLFLRGTDPPVERASIGELFATMRLIPVLLMAVCAFGIFDSAMLGLWPVFAIGAGVDASHAALLLMVLILGNILLQMPLGWLAERMPRRRVFNFCTAAGFIGAVGLYFLDLASFWAAPYLFVWGALAFGTYTVALMLLGEHLTGARLVAANASFGLMWGCGMLFGSAVSGGLIDAIGRHGFTLTIAGTYAVLLLVAMLVPPVRGR